MIEAGTDIVTETVTAALRDRGPLVLAVSGGRDSMVLLRAAAEAARDQVAAVATFDHGTGPAASRAADLVERVAREHGLAAERGRADIELRGEAGWRMARWSFLRRVSDRYGAPVATAHTRDDQVETVLMRVMRGSGARGLAGLYASSPIVRPLIDVNRETIARWASERGVEFLEDPSNLSRAHLRNRVRLDLLPALVAVSPALPHALLDLARRAMELRADVDAEIERVLPIRHVGTTVAVAHDALHGYSDDALALLWPAIAARVGLALDRRGTCRVATFTKEAESGGRIQLSGGFEVVLHGGDLLLRPTSITTGRSEPVPLADGTVVGGWRFVIVESAGSSSFEAVLPRNSALRVRSWQPGDRMVPRGSDVPRRVKGLLRDAGVDAVSRFGWPVVLDGDEIVWIPGVRRSNAATGDAGPTSVVYRCDPVDG